MTDPLARWLQTPSVSADPLNKWLEKPADANTSLTNTYQPDREPLYGEGEDQPSLLTKVGRIGKAIGKGMLESVDVFPEIHGGESIPLRARLARGFNIATMPLPLAAPFKVAKYAGIGTKAAMAAAGSATI